MTRPRPTSSPLGEHSDRQTRLRQATRAHYESFPFIEGGERRVQLWHNRLRNDLPDRLIAGARIVDIGSSIGEVAHSLRLRGADMVCVDLTHAALRRNQELHPGVRAVQSDALALPFPDATFDHAISIGVLHHTADCQLGLSELARVTRPGGTLMVLLYSRWTLYHLAYLATAALRRRVPVDRLHQVSGWQLAVVRTVAGFLIHQRLNDEQVRRLVADQFWTPRATFHSPRQVRRWAHAQGLTVIKMHREYFYSNLFVLKRCAK